MLASRVLGGSGTVQPSDFAAICFVGGRTYDGRRPALRAPVITEVLMIIESIQNCQKGVG